MLGTKLSAHYLPRGGCIMNIKIELTEEDLKKLIVQELREKLNHDVKIADISILVKSKQNYKSEWEVAAFRAEYTSRR